MASGKKNYFRHSFFARNDDFLINLVDEMGYQGYFLWFSLLEVCGEIASDSYPEHFKIHNARLLRSLRCRQDKLDSFLTLARLESRLSHTRVENNHIIQIHNFRKYLGKYDNLKESNTPNKRKEKEIKVNESKEPAPILSKKAKPRKTPTPIFEVEPLQLDEDIEASHDAVTVLTMLNSICFRAFRPTDFNLKYINARLKEKYSIEDFKKVIDYKHKEWSVKPEMKEYLQPSTLFGNKFDQYLNQALGSETLSRAEEDALIAKFFPGA